MDPKSVALAFNLECARLSPVAQWMLLFSPIGGSGERGWFVAEKGGDGTWNFGAIREWPQKRTGFLG